MTEVGSSDTHSIAKRHWFQRLHYRAGHIQKVWLIVRSFDKSHLLAVTLLLLGTVLTRVTFLGDPAVHMDEEFYLLVADRIWHGTVPYVDIWDRKPIGLFLIYALLRPLSPTGIVAYQIGAFFSAFMTAIVIRQICLRFCNNGCAILGGLLYLLFLPLLGGMGGQAPVFYNLPMAIAALLILQAQGSASSRSVHRYPYIAMALCGIAIQIKYSAVFEGMVFGLWLLQIKWRDGVSIFDLIRFGSVLITIALTPTVAVAVAYVLGGHFYEFFDANFLSIMRVVPPQPARRLEFLAGTVYSILPLLLMAMAATLLLLRRPFQAKNLFLVSWAVAAIGGFFALGNNYAHYALPVIAPLSILSATLFPRLGIGLVAGGVWYIISFAMPAWGVPTIRKHHINSMVTALRPYAAHGCIYVNDGPPILYLLTSSCLPTPYIFPEHLNNAGESKAVDAPREMKRLLRTLPSAIMVADKILDHPRNRDTAAMIDSAIVAHYHEVARLPDVFGGRQQIIYARNDFQ
ncbi:hypothetical protein [Sphingobium sp. R-21]|uniref:hypothetical protein n=1 Tax=Sphingobium sp. R-21 TaxID=3404056 RepID=UPI003CEB75AD